jgi:hypothetical protein
MPKKSEDTDEFLRMWTLYDHPKDQPDNYVARLWLVGDGRIIPTNDMFVADTLEELRLLLPPELSCLPRTPEDDPVIVETWL